VLTFLIGAASGVAAYVWWDTRATDAEKLELACTVRGIFKRITGE